MLKAAVTSPRADFYGVEFETVVYGRKSYAHPATFIPCASYEHAQAVAKAYNGVAFTEERPAVGAALVAADMAELERKGLGDLNHHGEPFACGLSRGAPMGVADYTAPDVTPQDALHFGIRRVALDADGYDDATGVYWGLPRNNMWHASASPSDAVMVSRWFRAPSYAHAVARVRGEFPNATTQRVP